MATEGSAPSGIEAALAANTNNAGLAPTAFAESPPREDQILNAVGFLSHPKVRDSSEETKRVFLEKKGLTKPEIDEAFRRVPNTSEQAPIVAASPAASIAQVPAVPPAGAVSQFAPAVATALPPPPPRTQSWAQIIVGASVLAAGVYAIKQYVIPYAWNWYHSSAAKRDKEEAEARQQSEELRAAIKCMQEVQEQMKNSANALVEVARGLRTQARPGDGVHHTYLKGDYRSDGDRSELSNETAKLRRELEELKASVQRSAFASQPAAVNGNGTPFYSNGGHGAPAYSVASSENGYNSRPQTGEAAPNPLGFDEVMEMVRKGVTPPNVRSDIDDRPPDPSRPLSEGRARAMPKPWERGAAQSSGPAYLAYSQPARGGPPAALSGDDPAQRASVFINSMQVVDGNVVQVTPGVVDAAASETKAQEDSGPPAPAPSAPSVWTPPPPPQATIPSIKSSSSLASGHSDAGPSVGAA